MVQRPTCTGLRVRTINDCNVIFHAVALGILPLVSRRLSIEERRAIHSGCIFVWEERTPTIEAAGDGLERWTDSRRWGASRLTKDFLFYQEKLPDVGDAALYAAMYQNRLIKQTYSIYLETQEGRRKWHLVAYCSPETGHQLMTVDDVPELAAIRRQVPEGKYQPARYSKSRQRAEGEQEEPKTGGALIEFPVRGTQAFQHTPSPVAQPHTQTLPLSAPEPVKPAAGAGISLPKAPSIPRRDPNWVLDNCVLISADIYQVQNRKLFSEESSKDMAPLVYMRRSPYQPRHPADNDAIRALDSVS